MIKEFEIQGRILNLPPEMTEEEFWHTVIGFIEENGWLFGGGLDMEKISGCVSGTSPDMTVEEFEKIFLDFVECNGWSFEGSIKIYEPEVTEFQYSFSDMLDDLKVGREIEFECNGKMYGIFNGEGNWFFFADNRDEMLCQFEETDTLLEKVKNLSIQGTALADIIDKRLHNMEKLFIF